MNEKLIQLKSKDNNHIALWKIQHEESHSDQHIFLTHGTFSDKRVCLGIAHYFAKKGYTCWIMEWRSHGASSVVKEKFNFETVALEDFPIVFEFLFYNEKIKHLNCITHSGGGLCLSMFLINFQQYISKINKTTFFGCQATGAALTRINYGRIWFGKIMSGLIGSLPADKIGMPHGETHYLMNQWYNWNLSKTFSGKNHPDYFDSLPLIDIPIFAISGKGDTFIAPPKGCQLFLNAFQNPKNQFLLCGKETGFKEDYNHSRVLRSRNAAEEIYPLVLEWMKEV